MEDLIAWAQRVGMTPAATLADDIVCVADTDLAYSIARHHELYLVETSVRGRDRDIVGAFDDVEDARRLLAMELGAVLRSHESLPRLAAVDLVPGFVIEQAPTAIWLSWFTGSAEFPIGEQARVRAVTFSRVERASFELIEASYLEPTGSPLYNAA